MMRDSAIALLAVLISTLVIAAIGMAAVGLMLVTGDAYCTFQPATKLVICKEAP